MPLCKIYLSCLRKEIFKLKISLAQKANKEQFT